MYFINVVHGIPYPNLQEKSVDISGETYKKFPAEYLSEFYKPEKKKSGFVKFNIDGDSVKNVIWDENAYQNWLAENPEPEPEPEPSEDIKEEIKSEMYTEMATAYREGVESIG